jgi:poly(A) polymerase
VRQKELLEQAKKIISEIQSHGHIAYIAGGFVRDYLLKRPSLDIDIATSATPQEILKIFPEAHAVGLSFGVMLVKREGHSFEVATFRKDVDYKDGRRPEKVLFTSVEEDAKRRSITINGMFFDPLENKIYDFVEGQKDLKAKIVRTIGDPQERFYEDRLRMLRALRFAATLGFQLEEGTKKAIQELHITFFPSTAVERVWQELKKVELVKKLKEMFILLEETSLLHTLFPEIASPLTTFPQECEVIIYITHLVHFKKELMETILERYKLSQREKNWVEKVLLCHKLIQEIFTPDLVRWAHFLADQESEKLLNLEKLTKEQQEALSHLHERLASPIARIQNKTPLVSAQDLLDRNIKSGPLMGQLLKLAEEKAIQENLHSKEEVLAWIL